MKHTAACYSADVFSFFFWIGRFDLWASDDVYDNDTFFPFSINEDSVFCCTVRLRDNLCEGASENTSWW